MKSNKEIVLVLGGSGMLGNALFRSMTEKYEVYATVRSSDAIKHFPVAMRSKIISGIDISDVDGLVGLIQRLRPATVVNCVGLIKQLDEVNDPLIALPLNSLFPHRLARICGLANAKLIHISTDCVFSGSKGKYIESDVTDAYDLYGKSKAIGEVVDSDNAVTLRTSIIGRELNSNRSLLEWFLAQEGTIQGFTKAVFSGLPTVELSRVIRDVVIPNGSLKGLYHVSADPINKHHLLSLIAAQYGKKIQIIPNDKVIIDRSLDSSRFSQVTRYKAAAWPDLIRQMYESDFKR